MEKPQQTLQTDEEATLVVSGEEATLVAPRFDDEETLVARPVVPLDAEDAAAAVAPAPSAATLAANAHTPPAYARRGFGPRRSWVLAVVLVSVLVGGVLGGGGLYLYQRQTHDEGEAAGVTAQPETPAEQQPQPAAPAPTAEASNAPQPEAETQAPPAEAQGEDAQPAQPDASGGAEGVAPAREPENVPAAGRRDDGDGAGVVTPKRGKKGDRDEELNRPRRRAADADSYDPGAREARRVDTIFYRQQRRAERRAARRARREAADTDRLRRIFEGTP